MNAQPPVFSSAARRTTRHPAARLSSPAVTAAATGGAVDATNSRETGQASAPLMQYLPGRFAVIGGGVLAVLALLSFYATAVLSLCGVLLLLMLGMAVADWLSLRGIAGRLTVRRQLPSCAGRGVAFADLLQIRNDSGRDLRILAREVLPAAAGAEYVFPEFRLHKSTDAELEARLCIPRRGRYDIGALWLRVGGRFGIIDWQGMCCPADALKVYPESLVARDELTDRIGAMATEKMKRRQQRGEGMEFESLSPFRAGDDVRHIDWRSSARHRSLLVRRHQIEQHRDVLILLDCGRLMGTDAGKGSKLDQAVNSALLLSEIVLGRGDRCGFGVFDDRILSFLPPQGGMRARQTILEHVYDVQSDFRESNFGLMFAHLQSRQRKRALMIVLSDLVDGATSDRFRAALASLAKSHVVVFAALRTPLLEDFVRQEAEDFDGVCRKAVALRLERERERTLQTLGHSGIRVIDCDPKELTAPLINSYLALRSGNLL